MSERRFPLARLYHSKDALQITPNVIQRNSYYYFARGSEVLWWARLSVCLFVCLYVARISPKQHARSLPNFCACCLWPWLGPLPAGWRNLKGNGQFWVFLPSDNAL